MYFALYNVYYITHTYILKSLLQGVLERTFEWKGDYHNRSEYISLKRFYLNKIVVWTNKTVNIFHNVHNWLHLFLTVLFHFCQLRFFFLLWGVETLVLGISHLLPRLQKPHVPILWAGSDQLQLGQRYPHSQLRNQFSCSWLCRRPGMYWPHLLRAVLVSLLKGCLGSISDVSSECRYFVSVMLGGGNITAFDKSACKQPDPLTKNWTVCCFPNKSSRWWRRDWSPRESRSTGLQIVGLLVSAQDLPDREFRGKDTLGKGPEHVCQKRLFLMPGRGQYEILLANLPDHLNLQQYRSWYRHGMMCCLARKTDHPNLQQYGSW